MTVIEYLQTGIKHAHDKIHSGAYLSEDKLMTIAIRQATFEELLRLIQNGTLTLES